VKVDGRSVERVLSAPDPKVRVLLIYGEDEGLVSERADRFMHAVAGDDPLARVRVEIETLSDDPGRLADEANAVPMFGGRRVIALRVAGNRRVEASIAAVLEAPPVDAWLVVTAGDLRRDSPLLKLLEPHPGAAVIRCYADAERDLDRLIDEEVKAASLAIAPDARTALRDLLGGDRRMSRSELAKLCLYAAGKGTITLADVHASSGDVAASEIDEVLDAMTGGDSTGLDRGYRRLLAAGMPSFQVTSAALRHFNYLEVARSLFDDGTPAKTIVERGRPPVYGSRAARVADAIARWPLPRIRRALAILDAAFFDSRLRGSIADQVVGQALLMVAALAPARKAGATP
jgi:DNA polymerase-3 subunit delta